MDVAEDAERVVASLAAWLERLTFHGLTTEEATARIIDGVVDWGGAAGWRVYRRAPSVVPLPPPMSRQHSVLDVACARPDGPPLAVEVDHTDRRRTVDKLVAEAAAGRIPIWVRWGTGGFVAPPPPVHMVTLHVTRHSRPGSGRLHSRVPAVDRPPPEHSADSPGVAAVLALPIPLPDGR